MTKKPTPAELAAVLKRAMEVCDQPLPDLDIDEEALWAVDISSLPSTPPLPRTLITPGCGKTQKISIRIHSGTLAAIKLRANELGMPYQRLINQQLRDANAKEPSL
jgi:predicted DNA binding CopG/RHH family protein